MPKKRTIEEIQEEFNERGYELLTKEYINQKQKMEFICNVHKDKGIQTISYTHFHNRGNGCHYCALEKQLKTQRFSKNNAKNLTENKGFIFVDIKYGSEIGKSAALIYYKCKNHLHVGVQTKTIKDMKNSDGKCPYCKKVLDTCTFKEKISAILPNIQIKGEYINSKKKVLCECTIHNEEFYSEPRKLGEGVCGCKKCKRDKLIQRNLLTHEEFVEKLKSLHPEIEVIGKYINSTTPIKLFCTIHNHYFYESPNTYLYKKKQACCPLKNVQTKTEEEFQKELYDRYKGSIQSLELYKGYFEKIQFKCLIHDITWNSIPANVLKGKGCPKCNASTNEIEINNYLDENKYFYIYQKRFDNCKDKKPLPFDFYLPELNTVIEYDGEGHYLERFYENKTKNPNELLKLTQYHDEIKNNYCKENNINIIRIPYWNKKDIKNILEKELNNIKLAS